MAFMTFVGIIVLGVTVAAVGFLITRVLKYLDKDQPKLL